MIRAFKYCFLILVLTFSVQGYVYAGSNSAKNLKNSKRELNRLNKYIKKDRRAINRLKRKEVNTVGKLRGYKNSDKEISNRIKLLASELDSIQAGMNVLDRSYNDHIAKIRLVRKEFARLCRSFFLSAKLSDEELLVLNASGIEEINNHIYMKALIKKVERMVDDLKLNIARLDFDKSNLASVIEEKIKVCSETEQEKAAINQKIRRESYQLKKIRLDKKKALARLKKRQSSMHKLKKIIAELIKKSSGSKKYRSGKVKKLSIGKISWPVKTHKILRSYGKVKNKETNTYYENPGIDIYSRKGSTVRAASGGEVSLVHWLPGYGNLCIIKHKNNIRTVYANMSVMNVKKGQKVRRGTILGKSGKSVDGEFLHFELWSGDRSINPANYFKIDKKGSIFGLLIILL